MNKIPTFDNNLLISRADIDRECRPCKSDEALVDRCIEEAQMLDIKPDLGDEVYIRLFDKTDNVAQQLLHGCTYADKSGKLKVFAGLRKALLYYAFGRVVRASSGVPTRFGFVDKADQYSDLADLKARTATYNEAFATADAYKAQALRFMADFPDDFGNCTHRKVTNNRLQLRKIGI